jgi:hypothetical protein
MVVSAGKEKNRTKAEISQPVSMGVGNALDDPVKTQPSEMVGHRSWLYLIRSESEQWREPLPQTSVGEADRQRVENQNGVAERLHVSVAEPER